MVRHDVVGTVRQEQIVQYFNTLIQYIQPMGGGVGRGAFL